MPTHSQADPDEERIAYTYRPPAADWNAWKDAVPRSTSLYERLDTLLAYDREHDLDGMIDAIESDDPENVPLTALRIRRRCASGVQNARAEGADDAAEALSEIHALADGLLDGE